MKSKLFTALACLLPCVFLSGCSMHNSQPITGPAVISANGQSITVSVADQEALQVCANVEASLPIVKATVSGGLRTTFVMDPALGDKYGAQMWGVSHGTNTLMTGKMPTPAYLKSYVLSFTDDNETADVAQTVATQVDAFDALYTLAYNKLTAAQGTTTNGYVLGVISKTGIDLLAAISGGVADATQQYAPVSPSSAPGTTGLASLPLFIDPRSLLYA